MKRRPYRLRLRPVRRPLELKYDFKLKAYLNPLPFPLDQFVAALKPVGLAYRAIRACFEQVAEHEQRLRLEYFYRAACRLPPPPLLVSAAY